MGRSHRLSMAGVVILCLASTQWNGVLVASEEPRALQNAASPSSSSAGLPIVPSPQTERAPLRLDVERLGAGGALWPDAPTGHRPFTFAATPSVFAGQVYQGRPYPMYRDHGRSITALAIGAIVTITGTAVLVYANRPECDLRPYAGGCGYGTKVIGGAVLAGGVVGLTVGALTW